MKLRGRSILLLTISDHYQLILVGAVEKILVRVSGWARLSDTTTFLKQNEILNGIEECDRELTVCTDGFTVSQPYAMKGS
jgi:hypothetical protein